ncbi:MAG: hypothetical protein QXJ16_01945 [Desulfurococcaceae archaeon]
MTPIISDMDWWSDGFRPSWPRSAMDVIAQQQIASTRVEATQPPVPEPRPRTNIQPIVAILIVAALLWLATS